LSAGVEVVQTLADCLRAIGNVKRLEIIQNCLQPHSHTEIVMNLKLNPASFKFHSKVLIDCGLLRKIERGKYETTELGKLMLELVNQAAVRTT
jgi:predicted transcriptional regulator